MRKTFFRIFVFRKRQNRLFSIFEFNPEFIWYFRNRENFAKQMRLCETRIHENDFENTRI